MLCSTRLDVAYVTQLVNIMMITHIHKYCHSFSVLGLLLWFFCVFCFGLLPLTFHRKKGDQKFKDINSNLMKSQIRWFYKYHSFFLHSLLLYILTSVKVLCNCQNRSNFLSMFIQQISQFVNSIQFIYSVLFMFKSINIKEITSSTITVSYNMSSCSLH